MTKEQEARATKIRQMAYELGLLIREHADDCFAGWDGLDGDMFATAWLLKSARETIKIGFDDRYSLAE